MGISLYKYIILHKCVIQAQQHSGNTTFNAIFCKERQLLHSFKAIRQGGVWVCQELVLAVSKNNLEGRNSWAKMSQKGAGEDLV